MRSTAGNDDFYFVFEDFIIQTLLIFSRDESVSFISKQALLGWDGFLFITSELSRILKGHIEPFCGLESELFFVSVCFTHDNCLSDVINHLARFVS